jgi:biopolymer transport protein ExbB/TolQ
MAGRLDSGIRKHMETEALATVAHADVSMWGLFMQASWIVKLVMIGLIGASVWTWAMVVDKLVNYNKARRQLDSFEQVFVGLFGTVVGIMTSFQGIAASKSTNLAVVAPGIAEALLATAIGLVAAIPAVIAYNKFSGDANKLVARMEAFADEFSAILSRQIDERLQPRAAAQ